MMGNILCVDRWWPERRRFSSADCRLHRRSMTSRATSNNSDGWVHSWLNFAGQFCSYCNVLTSSQVEDAMLMFDKQTNRHRGKFSKSVQFLNSVDHVEPDGSSCFQVIQTLLLMFVQIWSRQWGDDSSLSDLVYYVMFLFMFGGH